MANHLWTFLAPSISKSRDRIAWICREKSGRRTVTYQQLLSAITSVSQQLTKAGIKSNETVGIYAPNGPEWTAAAIATWKIGAIVAPIHIGNSDYEVATQIDAVKPKVILTHTSQSTNIQGVLCIPVSLDQIETELISIPEISYDACNIAVRIYTSGSTGAPKVVRLSHDNFISNVLAASKIETFNPEDRFISLLPFSHAMGLTANLLLPIYCGGSTVSPKALAANEILNTLSEEKISVVIAVPRLFRNIMLGLQKKLDSSSAALKFYIQLLHMLPVRLKKYFNGAIRKKLGGNIKVWVSGGSHLDGEICKFYHHLGLPLRQGYGLTETAPLTCVQTAFDPDVESVGKPIENVLVKINQPDELGNGEVWIRGPNVMLGYEDTSQNQDVFEDDWFKSGDIGKLDKQGKLTLTGRSKRLIVTEAGKNVYPEELETLLERNPQIKEAGVFELEMKPVCVLAMENVNDVDAAQTALKQHNKLVSTHNQITRFAIVDELPRTPLGKVAFKMLPEIFNQSEIK